MTCKCSEIAAKDIGREGLVALIALISPWEGAPSLITDILPSELEYMLAAVTEFRIPLRVHGAS